MRTAARALACLVLACGAAAAQQSIVINLHWITDTRGCKIWDSAPVAGESVSWTGPCPDGYADGEGTLTWYIDGQPHSTYRGELQGGHYAGRGVQTWPDGSRYDGEWSNDRADGQGTYRSVTETCAGAWVNGCFKSGPCSRSIGAPDCGLH